MFTNNDTLLGKAESNLFAAETVLQASTDDSVVNIAAYHVQQAVELSLKHVLECSGIKYLHTHAIEDLVDLLPEEAEYIAELIGDAAYMFTSWEAKTRYVKGFSVSLKRVQQGMRKATELIAEISAYTGTTPGAQDSISSFVPTLKLD